MFAEWGNWLKYIFIFEKKKTVEMKNVQLSMDTYYNIFIDTNINN